MSNEIRKIWEEGKSTLETLEKLKHVHLRGSGRYESVSGRWQIQKPRLLLLGFVRGKSVRSEPTAAARPRNGDLFARSFDTEYLHQCPIPPATQLLKSGSPG